MKKLKAIFDLRAGKTRYIELSGKLNEVKIPVLGIGTALVNPVQPHRDMDERQKAFDLWQETECAFFDCTVDEHNDILEKVAIAEAAGFPNMYVATKAAIISGH